MDVRAGRAQAASVRAQELLLAKDILAEVFSAQPDEFYEYR